ncbi:MAG: TonB-dependent receptor plug domain-containing protein [Proteobacteria bacterium]|nr:TonB-dependent receptor plug domain-containing protein [Pseudomonadota bacterium]
MLIALLTAWLGVCAAQEVSPPVLLLRPALPYPEGRRGGSETVELLLLINEEGRVERATPLAGDPHFTAVAVERARALRFSPARDSGVAIPVEIPFTWTFTPPEAPVDVRGQVLTAGPHDPVSGVRIEVSGHEATTDETGAFELRGLPLGDASVAIDDPVWVGASAPIMLDGESVIEVTLYASPTHTGEAVGVYRKSRQKPSVRRVGRMDLRDEPGAMGDPIRALQNLPGVVRSPLDAGWLIVRGGGPDDTPVFADGVEIPLLYHLGGLTSILHPEMVQTVALHPGSTPARLGGTLAGAAEVETARAGDTPRAVAGLNTAYAHVFAETPLGEASGLSLAARRSYLDAVLALALSDAAANIAPQFWDVAARAHTGRTDVLGLAIFDSAVTPGAPADDTIVLSQTSSQLQLRTAMDIGGSELMAQPWFGVERRRLETDIRDEQLTSTLGGLRVEVERETDAFTATAGGMAELRSYQLVRNDGFRQARIARADPYGELAGRLGEVELAGAVRLESLWVEDQPLRVHLSPRGLATWHATPAVDLSLELARTSQPADMLATVAFPEGRYLPLETSNIAALSAVWSLDRASLRGALWTRRFDLVGYELDGTLGPIHGRADGIELSADVVLAHTDLRAIAQVARSQRQEDRDDRWTPDLYDQPVRLHLQAQQRLPKRWTLGARARYASGFYNLRSVDNAFDLLTQSETPIPEGRLPAYASMDLRASKRWDWRTVQLTAYLDVLNVSGRRIPEPAINGIDEAIVVYTYGLPFLPLFGLEGSWWRQRRDIATSSP